ncbi:phosphatidylserine synthase 1-like isoform X1 [Antedon mediterranea]|uniref:phosphatidylserine synthase 1-like isoform X1 n=1 Tax=Antedon mediterranea TaxID=105859 RepID=UPI003AF613E7
MGRSRTGHRRTSSEISDHFRLINEQEVDDITLDFFYKPHTLTLLFGAFFATVFFAFTRTSEENSEQNIWNGLCCVAFFFLLISLLTFPNGPFTRPHPAIWRIVFGVSVMYLLLLVFMLFQNYTAVMKMIRFVFPDLQTYKPFEKDYATNCSDFSLDRLHHQIDWFVVCHFFGWVMKAMMLRHYGLCWVISVTWEITEVFFAHLLPNFAECWWDSILLDIFLCNALGIWAGMSICKKLEITEFHWESIKDIRSTSGKIRRAVLQFTPASWTHVRWLDPHSSYMRIIAVYILVLVTMVAELNTFFFRHIFVYPDNHIVALIRIILIVLMVTPTLRQYYTFVTDPACKRVGTQLWVFTAVTLSEALLCFKFGVHIFANTVIYNILLWLAVLMLITMVCLYFMVLYARKFQPEDKKPENSRKTSTFLKSPMNGVESWLQERTNGSTEYSHPYNMRKRVLKTTTNGL